MDSMYNWVKNIAFFMILMSLILNLLPNVQYQKYLKLFSGMVMIILVVSPLMGFLHMDESLERYLNQITFTEEINELKPLLEETDSKRYQAVIEEYKNGMMRDISYRANEEGLSVVYADIQLCEDLENDAFGTVEQMSLTVKYTGTEGEALLIEPVKISVGMEEAGELKETEEVKNLRAKIYKDYGFSEDKLQIYVKE